MARPGDSLLRRLTVKLGVSVEPLLTRRLGFLYWNTVSVGPGILADAGYLPGYFYVRLVCSDTELMIGNLTSPYATVRYL